MVSTYLILFIIAYLIGSIPTAVWLGKWFFGIDVREHGSGNAGATNVFRVIGKKAGIPVFIIDAAKGMLAVNLISFSSIIINDENILVAMQLILGLLAMVGHVFPLFANFKGGKGVATLFGVVLGIHFYAAIIAFVIFWVVLLLSKYVSLSSLTAGISFPFLLIFAFESTPLSLTIFSLLVAILLIITHQKNIGRLLRREENRINLRSKP